MYEGQRTFVTAGQSECCQGPYYAKDILREYCSDLALGGVWPVDCQART